jgi:hypothetical protein
MKFKEISKGLTFLYACAILFPERLNQGSYWILSFENHIYQLNNFPLKKWKGV